LTVVHVVPRLLGADGHPIGGAERYVLGLAGAMRRSTDTEVVTFAAPREAERRGEVDGVAVRWLGGTRFVDGQSTNPWSRHLAGVVAKASLVHCHQRHIVAATACAAFGRLLGTPVVATDHGGGGRDLSSYVPTRRMFRATLHVSRFSRTQLKEDSDRTSTVIFGGIDLSRFAPPVLAGTRQRLLFVGNLLPHKGVQTLIAALPDGLGLDVIGGAPMLDHAARLAHLASDRDVAFLGRRSEADIVKAYQQARAIVLPSVGKDPAWAVDTPVPELLGQTLMEGMACGAPGVCTAAGGMPEVVAHGVTGFVVPPGDRDALHDVLVRIRDDEGLVQSMSAAAIEHAAASFSWDSVVRRCVAAYRAVGWRG
jgi:glycosyltransferase involved in cell wall biosynthesis